MKIQVECLTVVQVLHRLGFHSLGYFRSSSTVSLAFVMCSISTKISIHSEIGRSLICGMFHTFVEKNNGEFIINNIYM